MKKNTLLLIFFIVVFLNAGNIQGYLKAVASWPHGFPNCIYKIDSVLYVAAGKSLEIYVLKDSNIVKKHYDFYFSGRPKKIKHNSSYLYISSTKGLYIFNIRNLLKPELIEVIRHNDNIYDFLPFKHFLFFANTDSTLLIFKITNKGEFKFVQEKKLNQKILWIGGYEDYVMIGLKDQRVLILTFNDEQISYKVFPIDDDFKQYIQADSIIISEHGDIYTINKNGELKNIKNTWFSFDRYALYNDSMIITLERNKIIKTIYNRDSSSITNSETILELEGPVVDIFHTPPIMWISKVDSGLVGYRINEKGTARKIYQIPYFYFVNMAIDEDYNFYLLDYNKKIIILNFNQETGQINFVDSVFLPDRFERINFANGIIILSKIDKIIFGLPFGGAEIPILKSINKIQVTDIDAGFNLFVIAHESMYVLPSFYEPLFSWIDIYDLTFPNQIIKLGRAESKYRRIRNVRLAPPYLYFNTNNKFNVLKFENDSLKTVGYCYFDGMGESTGLLIQDTLGVVIRKLIDHNALIFIRLRDQSKPKILTQIPLKEEPFGMDIYKNWLLTFTNWKLLLFDLTHIKHPQLIAEDDRYYLHQILSDDDYVYILGPFSGLEIYKAKEVQYEPK